jgi:hypothetical protein
MLYMDGLKKVRDELLLHANGVAHIGVRRSAISQKVGNIDVKSGGCEA